MNEQLQDMKQALEALALALAQFLLDGNRHHRRFIEAHKALHQAIEQQAKQECETCAAKRKRLLDAGFLKSPLRGEDHVG